MAKFRISYLIEAEKLGDIVKTLSPEQLSSMQLTPEPEYPGRVVQSGGHSQQALQQAFEVVRGSPGFIQSGSNTELILEYMNRQREPVSAQDLWAELARQGRKKDSAGLRRLVNRKLVKQVGHGMYVLPGIPTPGKPIREKPELTKLGRAATLILEVVRRAKGAKVSTAEMTVELKRHKLVSNNSAIHRLIDEKLIKKVGYGEYVYTGKD